ncbi:MAG TPA: hypothetical protein VM600_07925, partial [Actinomycetota bacterium]|nr:hypothetical protein [Actinomycetota bacterium]
MRTTRFVLAGLIALAAMAPGARAASGPQAAAWAELGSMISGTSEYVNGTYVWTDYAYDDRDGGAAAQNRADLIQLQIDLDADEVIVRAILQTLHQSPSTHSTLTVAFDTDLDVATGSGPDEFGWVSPVPMGIDVLYSSARAKLFRSTTDGWAPAAHADVVVDPAANVMEVRLPRAVLDPGTATWRAYAGLGIGRVDDLAFVGNEEPHTWQNAKQAAILEGRGSPLEAASQIDFGKIAARVDERVSSTAAGFHTLLYRSELDLGEGIRDFTIRGPAEQRVRLGEMYAGPYQPYLVWIPTVLPADPPLVTFLHGLGGTHTSSASMFGPGKFEPAAVVAMPLGRAGMSFFLGPGEQDVLDVTDDAIARYGVDPERVVLAGVSMGGFGAFRLGILRPDRWSAIVPLIGT